MAWLDKTIWFGTRYIFNEVHRSHRVYSLKSRAFHGIRLIRLLCANHSYRSIRARWNKYIIIKWKKIDSRHAPLNEGVLVLNTPLKRENCGFIVENKKKLVQLSPLEIMKTSNRCINWKTSGTIIGILSLIGSFPISASGDVSVSLHFLIVSGLLMYGIYKEKSEFLLPYLVELVVVLIQCALSIIKFMLLDPYDENEFESGTYDIFYDRPKHLTKEEKRFILAIFLLTSIVIFSFWCVIFQLYRRMRYCKGVDDDDDIEKTTNGDDVKTVECAKESKIYPNNWPSIYCSFVRSLVILETNI